MYRRLILGLTAAAAMVGFIGVGATSASAATTWVKTANTTQNAYSVNGYKAKVKPSATPAVTGYTNYSKTISVKNSAGTYVAKGVTSKWLGRGTYKVYSTFKYRKKVSYQTTTTVHEPVSLSSLNDASCTLTAMTKHGDDWEWYWSGTAKCSGTFDGHEASGTVSADWLYYNDDDGGVAPVGTTFVPGDYLFDEFTYGDNGDQIHWSHTATVTKYKYVYKNRYRYRYVTVKKIYNPPTISYTEFQKIYAPSDSDYYGDTLSRVRAIIGSNGTRTDFSDYGDLGVFYSYEWKQSNGDTVTVGFWDGRAYFKYWW